MKTVLSVSYATKAVLLAAMLGACQSEQDAVPISQSHSIRTDANAKTSVAPKLVKDGTNELQYVSDALGRPVLTKHIDHALGNYTTFTHTAQQIVTSKFENVTNKPLGQTIYVLNPLGQCSEYSVGGTTYKCEYFANGQLKKIYNAALPNERLEFEYEQAQGASTMSLEWIAFYDANSLLTKQILYQYDLSGGTPDLYPLNPEHIGNVSRYLSLFGKFHNTLPNTITEKTYTSASTSDHFAIGYSYTVDSNGYVTILHRTHEDDELYVFPMDPIERKYLKPIVK